MSIFTKEVHLGSNAQRLVRCISLITLVYFFVSVAVSVFFTTNFATIDQSGFTFLATLTLFSLGYSIPIGVWLFPLYCVLGVLIGTIYFVRTSKNKIWKEAVKGIFLSFFFTALFSLFFVVATIAFAPVLWFGVLLLGG